LARGGRQLSADDYGTRTLWDNAPAEQPDAAPSRWSSGPKPALDARLLDLEVEPESPFLRAQKRVPVRRGPVTRKTATRLRQVAIALVAVGCGATSLTIAQTYAQHAARFRIASRDAVVLTGSENVPLAQVLAVFAGDIGRNIFFIPVDERKHQLEQIPWVRSATVMRLLPNRVGIQVQERVPVAFAQVGSRVMLIDADGVLMEPPIGHARYSFPVISGTAEAEPHSTREARMKIYMRLIQELDSGGARYSESLSEVDLSDPEDVKITVADDDGAVVVHLGGENFLERFKTYIAHVQGWRQQFQKLSSVDLRYDKQVVVNPDSSAASTQPLTPAPEPHSAPVHLKARSARYADAHAKASAAKPASAHSQASSASALKPVPHATNAGQPGPWKTIVGPTPAPHAWRPHRSKRKAVHSRKTNSVH
jgi:cell division protein FtsQ